MNVQHVPAWKRLGLKLKQTNESSVLAKPKKALSSSDKKRKREGTANGSCDPNNHEYQLKKPRVIDTIPGTELNKDVHTKASLLKPKKAVTFTADTKVEDGDSAPTMQVLDFNSMATLSGEDYTNNKVPASKLAAKSKKAKQGRKDKVSQTTQRKASVALEYLDQFHNRRAQWKFNKNHETWLLKHALSTEDISPQHNLALASYIHGLKSVGARQRLAEQCRQAMKDEQSSTNDDKLRVQVIQALDFNPESNNDWTDTDSQLDLTELSRAGLILISLAKDLDSPREQKRPPERGVPTVKKNKSRTARIEIESSSSSESETSSDEHSINNSDNEKTSSGSSSGFGSPSKQDAN